MLSSVGDLSWTVRLIYNGFFKPLVVWILIPSLGMGCSPWIFCLLSLFYSSEPFLGNVTFIWGGGLSWVVAVVFCIHEHLPSYMRVLLIYQYVLAIIWKDLFCGGGVATILEFGFRCFCLVLVTNRIIIGKPFEAFKE